MMSAALHGGLAAVILLAPSLLPASSSVTWGSESGRDGSIRVGVVESIPGIALPSPEVVQENAPATESKTLNPPSEPEAKPKPKAEPAPDVLIPSKDAKKAKPKPEPVAVARGGSKPDVPAPSNAIPGTGGQAAVPYGQIGAGTGPATFGDEAFGRRFGDYVIAMTRAIREKWDQQGITGIVRGTSPRVYVTFTILRDGKISNFKVDQTSGNTRLDTSAHRAVAAATLPALPREYSGSSIDVRFYFEYGR